MKQLKTTLKTVIGAWRVQKVEFYDPDEEIDGSRKIKGQATVLPGRSEQGGASK